MTGPHHYSRAEEILAEIETTNALSNETETALCSREPPRSDQYLGRGQDAHHASMSMCGAR